MKLLLYCTKAKPRLFFDKLKQIFSLGKIKSNNDLNGKIVAECDFEVEEIRPEKYWHSTEDFDYIYNTGTLYYDDLLKKSCLMDYELDDYLGCEDKGYAIHIKNLHIFDEPRELSYYYRYCPYRYNPLQPIKVAPQNMMYAYNFKDYDEKPEYILISIRPQWLCKILNGEKTIEVRKKVLKEMIK